MATAFVWNAFDTTKLTAKSALILNAPHITENPVVKFHNVCCRTNLMDTFKLKKQSHKTIWTN